MRSIQLLFSEIQRTAHACCLAGLVALSLTITDSAHAQASPVEVQVTRDSEGAFLVTYQLTQPAEFVQFWRPGNGRRIDRWEFLDGAVLTSGPDPQDPSRTAQSLRRSDGEAFTRFRIRIPVDTRLAEKDYPLFQVFSDGSAALYTGHLNIVPPSLIGQRPPAHRFSLRARANEHVVLQGQLSTDAIRWRDTAHTGEQVYFGTLNPQRDGALLTIIDPKLPPALHQVVTDYLPEFYEIYAQQFGQKAPRQTQLFMSYLHEDKAKYWQGGTLGPSIHLLMHGDWSNFQAPQADEPLRDDIEAIIRFVAHEAAHIWNGALVDADTIQRAPWIHEGGADALAIEAMRIAGLLSDQQALDYYAVALNNCLYFDDGTKLFGDTAPGRHHRHYACGMALHLLLGRSADPATNNPVFELWRRMANAQENRGVQLSPPTPSTFSDDDFYAVVERTTREPSAADFMRRLSDTGLGNPLTAWVRALRGSGIEFTLGDKNAPAPNTPLARYAVIPLVRGDCPDGVGLSDDGQTMELIRTDRGCAVLPVGRNRVDAVGGIETQEDVAVYRYVENQCREVPSAVAAQKPTVTLTLNGNDYDFDCGDPLKPLPAFFNLIAAGADDSTDN